MLDKLPLSIDLETKAVLKASARASRALGELKGVIGNIPNSLIIVNTLTLREAKDSSEIENIVTTNDELFKAELDFPTISSAAKEVQSYNLALQRGFEMVKESGFLSTNMIVEIQGVLEQNRAGIRSQMGTVLKNSFGDVIYTPPQNYDEIIDLMTNLENYINIDDNDVDFLIKLAVIHHQFESIHPFYDGNGRTGRIINIIYLILKGLLDVPVLYLSSYIIRNKSDYYRLLQSVRDEDNWEEWILYILKGIEETSQEAIELVQDISALMDETAQIIKEKQAKIYSKDLLEVLFKHPYTKIEFLTKELGMSRPTATKYLNLLEGLGILEKIKVKSSNYYINTKLIERLSTRPM